MSFMFIALLMCVVTSEISAKTTFAEPFPPKQYQCPANEAYAKCTDAICLKTCEHLIAKPFCIAIADCDKPGCVCKEGFLRNSNGVCVQIQNSPRSRSTPACPVNEVFAKCEEAVCWKTCDHLRTRPPCSAVADCEKPACVCKDGMLRNNQGICIPTDQCPTTTSVSVDPRSCPVNEILAKCADAVCWKTCDHFKTKPPCAAIADCNKPTCVCRDGFLRNDRGICIPADQCPATRSVSDPRSCPVNEVLAECVEAVCWRTCEHLQTKPPCAALANCDQPACVCRNGMLRNDRGVCIPVDQCPATTSVLVPRSCPVNEILAKCADAVCWKTCDHLRTKPPCAAIADCNKPACVCSDGFLRNDRGICIPTDQCPAKISVSDPRSCPVNEVLAKCVEAVCWRTCEHLQTKPPCAALATCDKPACVCRNGMLRNDRGVCIPENQCPATTSVLDPRSCPVNEVLAKCADAVCWKTCDHLRTKPPCAAIADCNKPTCVCSDGFLRNYRGICIPADQCPATRSVSDPRSCPVNEVLAGCVEAVCWRTCEHLQTKPPCAALATCDKPACVCRNGMLRNDRGVCIPENQCPEESITPWEY